MDILRAFIMEDGSKYNVNILWKDGKPLFRACELATILDIRHIRTTLSNYDDDEKVLHAIQTNGGEQETLFLTQTGLYRLLMTSRKPIARPFQKWIAHIIESINDTGRFELQTRLEQLEKNAAEQLTLKIMNEGEKFKEMTRKAKHDALVDAFKGNPERYVVYFGIIRENENGNILIKIGSTKEMKNRSESLIEEFGSMTIIKIFECPMNDQFERFLQRHPIISPYVYREIIHNGRRSNGEVFNIPASYVSKMIAVATHNKFKFMTIPNTEQEIELERLRFQTVEKQLEVINSDKNILEKNDNDKFVEVIASCLQVTDKRRFTLSRGDKIQRYSPDGKTLIKTYSGAAEAMRDQDVPDVARPVLMQSIVAKTLYKKFRWAALTRDQEDSTFQDIGDTIESKTVQKGYVAMLNLSKTEIMQVFCDQKEASENRQFKSCAAISKAIKLESQSGGHYFKMWNDCDHALKDAYLATHELPIKRVRANGSEVHQFHPITGDLIQKHASIEDVIRVMKISRITLKSAIEFKTVVKGFKWGLA